MMKRALLPLLLLSGHALAVEPSDYMYSPIVEEGEHEIDFKYGRANAGGGQHDRTGSIGFGWGATSNWFTEVYVAGDAPPGESMTAAAYEWENRLQLTETGKYPVDAGLLAEVEYPRDSAERRKVRGGLMLQSDLTTGLQGNLNLLLEREFGGDFAAGTDPQATRFLYQYQLKLNWRPELDFGLQGYGETGKWNDWGRSGQQFHNVGPAIFGKFGFGGRAAIRYNAAWLVGTNGSTPDSTLRAQVEYEF